MAGYIYAPAPSRYVTEIRSKIKADHLSSCVPAGKRGFEEREPTITLYWGIGTGISCVNYHKLYPALAEHVSGFLNGRKQPLMFIPGYFDVYETRNWDVLVLKALENHQSTKVLKDLNESIQDSFDFQGSTFPFEPHITVAYLSYHAKEYAFEFNRQIHRDTIKLDNVYLGIQGYDWKALLYTQSKDNEDGKEERKEQRTPWTHNRR